MPYYRGLALSMVEAVDLTLDGARAGVRTTFTVHGNTYTSTSSAEHRRPVGDGERAELAFETDQPLAPGSTTSPSPCGCGSPTCRCPAEAGIASG